MRPTRAERLCRAPRACSFPWLFHRCSSSFEYRHGASIPAAPSGIARSSPPCCASNEIESGRHTPVRPTNCLKASEAVRDCLSTMLRASVAIFSGCTESLREIWPSKLVSFMFEASPDCTDPATSCRGNRQMCLDHRHISYSQNRTRSPSSA